MARSPGGFDNASVAELVYTSDTGGGRTLVAKKSLQEDELVHESRLLAASPLEKHAEYLCCGCHRISAEPLPLSCPRCAQAFFCGPGCQARAMEAEHSLACPVLAQWGDAAKLDDELVSLLRLLLQVYASCFRSSSAVDGQCDPARALAEFRTLHFHREAWNSKERRAWRKPFEFFRGAWGAAKTVWSPTLDDLEADIGRLECNVFSLYGECGGGLVGHAIYPSAGVALNHSCAPNCYADDKGVDFLRFYATCPVRRCPSLPAVAAGEELRISYVDVKLPVGERRNTLREQYHFDCPCSACKEEVDRNFNLSLVRFRLAPIALSLCRARAVEEQAPTKRRKKGEATG